MVEAKDLRIYNLVLFKGQVETIRTVQPMSVIVSMGERKQMASMGEILPIQLTPEVLKKAGFIKWVEYWHFQGFKLWHDGKGFYHINSELLVHVDTLHHLQNLFYALTQTELEAEL
jgi:hypothetical protein